MSAPLLSVRGLERRFASRAPGGAALRAVDGVDFELAAGEMLALVGESGSGKSTLLELVAGLQAPSAGSIRFDDRELTTLAARERRALRRSIQVVFQDPYESLDPKSTVAQIVAEPLVVHRIGATGAERDARAAAALAAVGLEPYERFASRRPSELSGGQRQRIAIAAALAVEPRLLLADEPVSMLDVSVRAEILNLLGRLRRERGIAILFVTHDLATAAAVADRIAVLYLGRIVESGPAKELLRTPAHPYTKALVEAHPVADPRHRRTRRLPSGEIPNAAAIPTGCRFRPRCPVAIERCGVEEPSLRANAADRAAACWLVEPEPGSEPGR